MTGENDAPTPTPTPTPARRRPDGLAIGSYLTFVIISGLMVFGFASALGPAVEGQDEGPCRALAPEPRDGSMREMNVLDMNGEPVSLDSLRGKFVVLNFWATWCGPCVKSIPELRQLAKQSADDDVTILSISLDEQLNHAKKFIQNEKMDWPQALLGERDNPMVRKQLGISSVPVYYVLDPEGQLRHRSFRLSDAADALRKELADH